MGFILGAIVGAAAMWVYGDRLRAYLDIEKEKLPTSSGESGPAAEPSGARRDALAERPLGHLRYLGPLHAPEHQPETGQD